MKKRVLFIDRDGTIIIEPPTDYQVDSLEKLEMYPKVIRNLYQITQQLNYELVMVTNQDGLGTDSFPEETFWPAHNKMLKTLEQEGITFDEILIDRTFEHENAPTRKPRTGLMTHYLDNPEYDLANSFVLGDRLSDMQLAQNLGSQGILLKEETAAHNLPVALTTTDWDKILAFLLDYEQQQGRTSQVQRTTKETDILIDLNLDGTGQKAMDTGVGFFDHMLDQLAHHGKLDLAIKVKGDLHIDAHHTIEDTAIALGQAFREALGNKRGIERYGFFNLVMDETLAQVALDFSGRNWLVWQTEFKREKVGGMPTEMFEHFFKSFSDHAQCNVHIRCEGKNEHHMIEAIFKAFARSIKMAKQVTGNEIPSTKGVI
ncbi:bifunctional imidazole glycerol-phosphate dehydratase/histidinol phosphatase [marine bacterium AO1-C]|nr:bifunctional imidazole glycerol-phosphate dehydratase/histidinol phosphatase [marine bacterium AO1-C]